MGRVRRYRKIKACDPFTKHRGSSTTTNYDDPPDVEVAPQKKRRRTLDWDNENDREKLLQQQALRELKASSSGSNMTQQPKLKIEPIRVGESLKRYSKRVREVATNLLSNQVPKMTATAKKRKEKLKTLKLKKKGISQVSKDQQDEITFGSRSDGFIRHSDRNDSSEQFKSKENIKFGETVQTPPDLSIWKDKLKKKIAPAKQAVIPKNAVEIEKLRLQAIEAYHQIKDRRKKQDM